MKAWKRKRIEKHIDRCREYDDFKVLTYRQFKAYEKAIYYTLELWKYKVKKQRTHTIIKSYKKDYNRKLNK